MFPFFIMHYCTFVLVADATHINMAVDDVLEPSDDAIGFPPHRIHLDQHNVGLMAEHYRIDPANLHELAEKLPDWIESVGGVDCGGLYYFDTSDSVRYWGGYFIGGRWDGRISDSQRNVIKAKSLANSTMLVNCLPHYVVTPDGEWIERTRRFLTRSSNEVNCEEIEQDEWLQIVSDSLNRWPDHHVVCVDINS